MPTVIAIDPVTRLEGHLRVEITVDTVSAKTQVVDARVSGTSFRGFEQMLVNRDPREVTHLTQRICGVCPIPHGLVASQALEQGAKFTAPPNARHLRNLVLAANFIGSHVLHFYQLALLDFVAGPSSPLAGEPGWDVDRRFNASDTAQLNEHYRQAIGMVRQAQEMGAIFAGRMPHSPAFIAGGFTTVPTETQIVQFRKYLADIVGFLKNTYLPDVERLALQYPDYNHLGRGPGNFIAFGAFDLDPAGARKLIPAGRVANGRPATESVDPSAIIEQVNAAWYTPDKSNLHPSQGTTQPAYPKDGAYSWIKAPRYAGEPYETGPLARMWISGVYRQGISVNDRHRARAQEALRIAETLTDWLAAVQPDQTAYAPCSLPGDFAAVGLTEAPRGALGHWLQVANRKVARYQVITPTCWNASPRDDIQKPGPLEQALVGTPIQNPALPVEALRVVHSFDPCLACAVHVVRPLPG